MGDSGPPKSSDNDSAEKSKTTEPNDNEANESTTSSPAKSLDTAHDMITNTTSKNYRRNSISDLMNIQNEEDNRADDIQVVIMGLFQDEKTTSRPLLKE